MARVQVGQKLPAGQSSGFVECELLPEPAAQNLPVGHTEGRMVPALGQWYPAGQVMQEVASSAP